MRGLARYHALRPGIPAAYLHSVRTTAFGVATDLPPVRRCPPLPAVFAQASERQLFRRRPPPATQPAPEPESVPGQPRAPPRQSSPAGGARRSGDLLRQQRASHAPPPARPPECGSGGGRRRAWPQEPQRRAPVPENARGRSLDRPRTRLPPAPRSAGLSPTPRTVQPMASCHSAERGLPSGVPP